MASSLAVGVGAGSLGCSGTIHGSPQTDAQNVSGAAGASANAGAAGSSGASGAAGTAGAAGGPPIVVDGCEIALHTPRAVLSPLRQYQNALRDLLGEDAVRDEDELVEIEFEVIDRGRMSTSLLDQVLRLAERATESLRSTAGTRLGCTSLADRACVQTGLTTLARRAWKRTPAATEMAEVMGVYDKALELTTGLPTTSEDATLTALMAVLTAPSAVYRTEFESSAPLPDGSRGLTGQERAAQIASLLLDSIPDEPLLAAAESGALLEPAGVSEQLTRLLAEPRVREHLVAVMLAAFKVPKLFESPKDGALFPDYTPELQLAMYEESKRFLEDVFERNAPIDDLMLSRRSFVNRDLADLYGIAYPGPASGDDFVQVDLPATRTGMFTQASVLSVLARPDKTSVVARGLFVRGALACMPKIDGPPASVAAQVMMQLSASSTQQELAAYRAMTSPCMGCHSQFDRFGLVLEAFDPMGRERDTLPAPIDLTGLADLTQTVDGAATLAQVIAGDSQFVDCLTERTLAYALGEVDDTGSTCIPDSLATTLHAPGASMQTLISAVVAHPAFAQRAAE